MTPHSSEDKNDDLGAAVAQFRRALDRRVAAHFTAHPNAGIPHVARAAVPRVSTHPWARAVAAAVVIAAVGGAIVWPRGAHVYAAGNDGLQVTLPDDSRVEMRAHAEMTVDRGSDGIQIDLKKGDIIVAAAKQGDRRLSVRTMDMTVALSTVARSAKADVDGIVFLVNAGNDGSRVGVIGGEVLVRERGTPLRGSGRQSDVETRLRPGEQVATSPALAARPVRDDILWSRNADVHLAILESFRRAIAQTSSPLSPVVPAAERQRGTGAASPAGVEFEEASVRKCDPNNLPAAVPGARGGGGANSFYMTPGRAYALCMTPATLIRMAYGYFSVNQEVELWFIHPEAPGRMPPIHAGAVYTSDVEDGQRVRGGPGWVRSEAYTIEAVAGDAANAASMSGPMLLALLERRFGLKAHIETEQTPAFSLVVAPGGLKMKEGTCTADPSAPRPLGEVAGSRRIVDVVRRNLNAARRGDTTTGSCGLGVADNGPNRIIVGAGAGLPPLRGILGAHVTDRTGISDTRRFNYALEFLLDARTRNPFYQIFPAGMDMQIAADASRVQPAPDLFTALEQQLGLRLEPAQVPRDYIVIDAIKRPDAN